MYQINFNKYLKILVPLLVVINVLILGYLFFGFGTVEINSPPKTVVFINENKIGEKRTLKLRPGTYDIRVANDEQSLKPTSVSVNVFSKKQITPEKLDAVGVLNNATSSPGSGGKFVAADFQYLNDNSWLVAKYYSENTSKTFVCAFMYVYDQWQTRACFPKQNTLANFDTAENLLPSSVLNVFNKQKNSYYAED